MKAILLAVMIISIPFTGCKKSKDEKKQEPEKIIKKPEIKKPLKKVVVKPKKKMCENAFSTFNNCLVKPKVKKELEKKLILECDKMMKGKNSLYIKDVKCLASLAGECKDIAKCLPKKDKNGCEIFADTRIKCRPKEPKDSLKIDLREYLVQECEMNIKNGDKELVALYNCFKSAKEVCYNSHACFINLMAFEKKNDAAAKLELEKKFKKLDRKARKIYENCMEFTANCFEEYKSPVKKGVDPLVGEQCVHDMVSENKESKKKIECLKNYTKKAGCKVVATCLKAVK